jgi:hypothetical protein
MLNRTARKSDFPSYFTHSDSILNDASEIANGFNNYFVNIGQTLANKIKSFSGSAIDLLPSRNLQSSLFFEPVSPTETFNVINSLKPKTSCGYDHISPKLIKNSAKFLSEPLTYISNTSFQTGIFPSNMKIAKVVPIFKSNDNTQFNNYRPISILPAFSKILEKLVHKRLYHYLNTNKLLSMSQYGFQRHMSTEQAILEFQDRIVDNLASKKWCSGIFLDLSKAFDTLDHAILLSKMHHLGVRGIALQWFKSYLSNRSQFVELENIKSSHKAITCGVPQGSILGPLLFLVYINDIVDHITNCNAILFADDTTIIFNDINFDNLILKMNETLTSIYKWLCLNKLSLNVDKTNYVLFRRPQRKLPYQPEVLIDSKKITHVKETKFLGVYIDENMSWKKHCNVVASKCLKVVSILTRLKHSLPMNILLTIYSSLFLPHISYAITAWGNCSTKDFKRLSILQKKAIRIISKSRYNSHTQPLFKVTKMLTIEDLYRLDCCKILFKVRQNILKPYFINALRPNYAVHTYNTRQTNDIFQQNVTMSIQSQLLNHKISTAWNKLPISLKSDNFTSIHSFTRALKTYFLSMYSVVCQRPNCYVCMQ